MKKFIFISLALILSSSCEKQEKRYSQQSSEIETVKSLVTNYNNKTYDTSIYADTSKTRYNSVEKSLSASETMAYHQANDANYVSRGFLDKDQEFEMVVTDDGETWVNCWLDWKGILKEDNQEVTIPIHLTYQFKDGKIVREVGIWDGSPVLLALQEIEANKEMSADEKVIKTTIENIVNVWNTKDKELMNSSLSRNILRTDNGTTIAKKTSEYEDFIELYHAAFPDFKVKINKMVIDGNKAFLNWTCTGTNKGEFMGNPPTNKKIETHGFSIWSFDKEGKGEQEDAFYDNLVVYQQLGYSMPVPN
ncbi:hypothetical protein KCTC52924_00093 [Arenibacter antarcticus]|uniref:Ester cyclase n=1 Tax=Arenibacter antarcticus TaxID=2040469 RepID=A0ABW5VJH1_9FLAO|nr:ester cyclase [Arenibacter sp. H213]MCM4169140.1 hypothetical protein [Arenibacter sp. H213]